MSRPSTTFTAREFGDYVKHLYLKNGDGFDGQGEKPSVSPGEDDVHYDRIELNCLGEDCLFLLDFKKQVIAHRHGFKEVLGYEDDEVNLELFISSIHPEDAALVRRVVETALANAIDPKQNPSESSFMITCRLRQKDGTYIHALAQTLMFDLNPGGIMTRSLFRISDISFLQLSTWVRWSFVSERMDQDQFHEQVVSRIDSPFTQRELDVIRGIENQMTTEQISRELNISRHTVATHRKNILKKSNTRNAKELVEFCRQLGVI